MPHRAVVLLLAAIGVIATSAGPLRAQQNGTESQASSAVLEAASPQNWALLIGIDDYTELGDNKYCADRVSQLQSRLVAAGWPVSNIFLMSDRARSKYLPSRENIGRQLVLLPKLAAKNDFVLVVFRGHVTYLGGKSYLCPAEASLESPKKTLVPIDSLYRRFARCKARNKLLVIDPVGTADGAKLPAAFFKSLRKAPAGTAVLVGCGPGQTSLENEKIKGGAFMAAVMRSLEGDADSNGDQNISLSELVEFTRTETTRLTDTADGSAQTPDLFGKVDSNQVIGRVPEHKPSEGFYPTLGQDAAETSARLEAVVGINPRSLRAFNQAVSYFSSGDFREAAEYCDNAAAMDPENRWAHVLRGCINCQLGEFAKAVEDYAKLGIPLPCHARTKTDLKQGDATTATVLPGDVLYVTTVKGDWLWVDSVGNDKTRQGWIFKRHVK